MRKSELKRGKPLRSKGAKARREEPLVEAFRSALRDRSRGMCEANTPACPLGPHQGHHAHHCCIGDRRRGVHDPERGLYVCAVGHAFVHSEPAMSYAMGWLIRDGGEA